MNSNVNLLVVGDMNTETGRALTAALASDPTLAVPYRLVHIDEVRALLPGIRATPAVGVVLWADDMQEAVTIAQVAKEAAYLASQGEVTSALDYAADEVAASLPVEIYDAWTPGEHYAKDKLLQHGGKLYRVAQELDASDVYPPDAEGCWPCTGPSSLPTRAPSRTPSRGFTAWTAWRASISAMRARSTEWQRAEI